MRVDSVCSLGSEYRVGSACGVHSVFGLVYAG